MTRALLLLLATTYWSLVTAQVLIERTIPTPNSAPHCVVSDSRGRIWYAGSGSHRIGFYDPATDQFREIPTPTPNSRPHGIAISPGDLVWVTLEAANKIARVNPDTLEITEYAVPTPNGSPHTPIYDGRGALWFTEQNGNRIGRLTIATGQIEEFPIPTPNSGPYGVIADRDGNAWFCSFGGNSNRIGRVDAGTGRITEYATPTPNSGPRRPWIDSRGRIWITLNRAHKIALFDPSTERFREWDTPSRGGEPYGIVVDRNDQVWYNEFTANTLVQFDPATERFTVYPMDPPRALIRIVAVDPAGRLWYGNNASSRIGLLLPGTAVINAASNLPAFAPGALVSIFGSHLTPNPDVTFNDLPAPILFTSSSQVNAQIPPDLPTGPARLRVRRAADLSITQPLTIDPAAPGIFAITHPDFRLITAQNPAGSGGYVVIWCTGLGRSPASAQVTIAGRPATVVYAGPAPGFPGLDQVNAQLPASLPAGPQPLQLSVAGATSNLLDLAVR